jgi:hypothetical protein
MDISEFLIRNLANCITGDDPHFPYRKGEKLVYFFNQVGYKDVYPESVIGSRRIYTQTRIRESKSENQLKKIVEMMLDPKEFFGLGLSVDEAAEYARSFLSLEGYNLKKENDKYKLVLQEGALVKHKEIEIISHEFIIEQVDKCEEKLSDGDYDGAITNARLLIESICISIIEKITKEKYISDGKLQSIYKDLKSIMNLNIDKDKYPDYIIEMLSGLNSIVNGISALSNKAADRHHREYKPKKHHAKFAVNSAFSFCVFITESYLHQFK